MLFGSSARHAKTPTEDVERTKHILEFLHQRPTSFGINRTSWTQRALIHVYKERYDELISRRTVQRLIKSAGNSWRKARRILASPDSNYDEKVEVLSRTLMSLTESELFSLSTSGVQYKFESGMAKRAALSTAFRGSRDRKPRREQQPLLPR